VKSFYIKSAARGREFAARIGLTAQIALDIYTDWDRYIDAEGYMAFHVKDEVTDKAVRRLPFHDFAGPAQRDSMNPRL